MVRFRFPKFTYLAFVLVMMGTLVAVACGGTETVVVTREVPVTQQVTVVVSPTPEPTPTAMAKVSRLRVGAALEGESNDPHTVGASVMAPQGIPFEGLSEEDEFFVYQPQLAESWSTKDGFEWIINLRKGVQWHFDYGEFTSKDVRFTMERQSRDESIVVEKAKMGELLSTMETPDDYTLILHSPILKAGLCCEQGFDRATWGMFISKAYFDDKGQAGIDDMMVGTGPYQYVERRPGESLLVERVPYDHYRISPEFDEIQLFLMPEPSTRLAAMLTNEIDLTNLPSTLNATAIAGGMEVVDALSQGIRVDGKFGGLWQISGPFDPDAPFADIRVREAMNRAIDRDLLNETILGGRGTRMAAALFLDQSTDEFQNEFDAKYGYDLPRAKALLAEAGYANGFDMTMFLVPRGQLPEAEDLAEAVGNMWQELGLNVSFESRTFEFYIRRVIARENFPNETWFSAGDRDADALLIGFIYQSKGCCPYYEHPFLDEQFAILGQTSDAAAREAIIKSMSRHIFDVYGGIPMWWVGAQFVINPEVIAEYRTSGQRPPRHLETIKMAR